MKTLLKCFVLILSVLLCSCNSSNSKDGNPTEESTISINTMQGTSLMGEKLISEQADPEKDSLSIANYLKARKEYNENPDDADAIIWFGRRTAYLGDYLKAIKIYSEGIQKFPDDARMYRHRGHRYITLRMFDKAIADFQEATKLIEGEPDIIEPDGIPNNRNMPVSTLNTNIWYHLGLAHYLKGNMQDALYGFHKCLDASTNPDMYVAAANWVYMINRRMNNTNEAEKVLKSINKDMDVFENMAYHNLLLFYKGALTENELKVESRDLEYLNDAIAYGIGNWYYYNGDTTYAKNIFRNLLDHGAWASFGTLAAEADMYSLSKKL